MPIEHSKNLLAAYEKNHVPCELIVVKGGTHGFGGHDGFSDRDMPHALAATNAWFETHLLPKTIAKPDVDVPRKPLTLP